MKDYGVAGLGDETGPLETMNLRDKKMAKPKKRMAPPMMKKKRSDKMRTLPIDGGSVELPEGEQYGLERPMKKGGSVKKYAKGGSVSRGDGCCKKGHTKGKMV
jgi:hypothetical protein